MKSYGRTAARYSAGSPPVITKSTSQTQSVNQPISQDILPKVPAADACEINAAARNWQSSSVYDAHGYDAAPSTWIRPSGRRGDRFHLELEHDEARLKPTRSAGRRWARRIVLAGGGIASAVLVVITLLAAAELHYVYFDRHNLPDLRLFVRTDLPTIGRVYDAGGRPLIEMAHERREIVRYEDIPPIVRDAILAAEDKRFFTHEGVDYFSLPRVLTKVRIGSVAKRLIRGHRYDEANAAALFPQGGSTITQQLVRGTFLVDMAAREDSNQLHHTGFVAALLSTVMGARAVNMLVRKQEEIRLSLWLEQEMETMFGSKRRAKEEILARYANLVYLGDGQYGFARAAKHYFGKPLNTFTVDDADKAALLAGIAKAPRYYAPNAVDTERVLRRRNQTLALMQTNGFLSPEATRQARQRPLERALHDTDQALSATKVPEAPGTAAVVGHVLEELTARYPDLDVEDLLQGRIQVHATINTRMQNIVDEALEHGLSRYEQRYPESRGLIQGAVVLMQNSDGRILAETGGRRVFNGRAATYTDYNRVTQSLRQPGSAMKPIVYLAAFQHGGFTLDTLVPDWPTSVPDGPTSLPHWVSNYDDRFKGLMPVRRALAESRNTVAVRISKLIGIDRVLQTARSLGIHTPLKPYAVTALGTSEMNLLELANAYRAIASGIAAEPYVIQAVVGPSGDLVAETRREPSPVPFDDAALALVQEGLRGVVRMPTGTARALGPERFPIAVMGKTGTTDEFRDAIFVGSTYGPDGLTAAIRIGFDDNRTLGSKETGGRLALPVFRELMLEVYGDGVAPEFPEAIDERIAAALLPQRVPFGDGVVSGESFWPSENAAAAGDGWVMPVENTSVAQVSSAQEDLLLVKTDRIPEVQYGQGKTPSIGWQYRAETQR